MGFMWNVEDWINPILSLAAMIVPGIMNPIRGLKNKLD